MNNTRTMLCLVDLILSRWEINWRCNTTITLLSSIIWTWEERTLREWKMPSCILFWWSFIWMWYVHDDICYCWSVFLCLLSLDILYASSYSVLYASVLFACFNAWVRIRVWISNTGMKCNNLKYKGYSSWINIRKHLKLSWLRMLTIILKAHLWNNKNKDFSYRLSRSILLPY